LQKPIPELDHPVEPSAGWYLGPGK